MGEGWGQEVGKEPIIPHQESLVLYKSFNISASLAPDSSKSSKGFAMVIGYPKADKQQLRLYSTTIVHMKANLGSL